MESLSSLVPREKFDGPSSTIEPLLGDFQEQWGDTKMEVANTHLLCQQLVERVQQEAWPVVDYSGTVEALEAQENGLRVEEERAWQGCDQREHRWNLTILLNQFEPAVEKVRIYQLQFLEKNLNLLFPSAHPPVRILDPRAGERGFGMGSEPSGCYIAAGCL